VVAVRVGERLTEGQALEGLLLLSGNNMATLRVRWDAGSERAFVAKMNARARALGLTHTRYTGASGVQASTASTAGDQVRLAMRAMDVLALRQTVAVAQATLPVAGRQYTRTRCSAKTGSLGSRPAPPRAREGASYSPPTSGSPRSVAGSRLLDHAYWGSAHVDALAAAVVLAASRR
jgi:D-alanyl-D-alanine carboxypeptidase (penicillin-binding protein 5/6)